MVMHYNIPCMTGRQTVDSSELFGKIDRSTVGRGMIEWPPQFLDSMPPNFSLRSHIKSVIYKLKHAKQKDYHQEIIDI